MIKAVATELARPLSQLLNYCMREGHYPENFKVARVVPVFKSEDPTQFSNYRPVSVLPVLSQVFERVLYSRLTKFLDEQNISYKHQSYTLNTLQSLPVNELEQRRQDERILVRTISFITIGYSTACLPWTCIAIKTLLHNYQGKMMFCPFREHKYTLTRNLQGTLLLSNALIDVQFNIWTLDILDNAVALMVYINLSEKKKFCIF